MNDELKQQLKDAGFPFKGTAVPTLMELREACGDQFTKLIVIKYEPYTYIPDTIRKKADNGTKPVWGAPLGDEVNEGHTPEESIAKLYIALKSLPK